jgi:hypothetical protein
MRTKDLRIRNNHRISFFLVLVLGSSILGFAPSSAANPTTSACVNQKTGAMRILLKGTCKAKVEKRILITTAAVDKAAVDKAAADKAAADKVLVDQAISSMPSSVWLSPQDLLASRQGFTDSSGIADRSSVSSLVLTNNFFHAEALDLAQEKERVVFRAVPKGWSQATSLTVTVFWLLTENSTAPVSFEVYLNSRGAGDDFGSEDWGTGAAPEQNNALVVSKGSKIMNTHSFVWNNGGRIADGELLTLSLYREGNLQKPSVYSGKVYVMGVSIQPNFSK